MSNNSNELSNEIHLQKLKDMNKVLLKQRDEMNTFFRKYHKIMPRDYYSRMSFYSRNLKNNNAKINYLEIEIKKG